MAQAVPSSQNGNSDWAGILILPDECISHVASFLLPVDVAAFSQTCSRMNDVLTNDNLVWRSAVQRELGYFDIPFEDIRSAARLLMTDDDHHKRNERISWRDVCIKYHNNAQLYICDSRYPLHRAVEERDTLTTLYLIQRAQELGLPILQRDMDGISVLDTAASVGDVTIARVLCIRKHADPGECAPDGWTPLMKACSNGDLLMTAVLLILGATRTINAQTSHYRWTALHYACKGGHYQCARVLLEFGANKDCVDFAGRTPLALWGTGTSEILSNSDSAEEILVRSMLR